VVVFRTVAPGRRLGLSAAYASASLSRLSPDADSDYRYYALSVSASWTF
jgi:hypothetical protein